VSGPSVASAPQPTTAPPLRSGSEPQRQENRGTGHLQQTWPARSITEAGAIKKTSRRCHPPGFHVYTTGQPSRRRRAAAGRRRAGLPARRGRPNVPAAVRAAGANRLSDSDPPRASRWHQHVLLHLRGLSQISQADSPSAAATTPRQAAGLVSGGNKALIERLSWAAGACAHRSAQTAQAPPRPPRCGRPAGCFAGQRSRPHPPTGTQIPGQFAGDGTPDLRCCASRAAATSRSTGIAQSEKFPGYQPDSPPAGCACAAGSSNRAALPCRITHQRVDAGPGQDAFSARGGGEGDLGRQRRRVAGIQENGSR